MYKRQKCEKAEANVDNISRQLQSHQIQLMKDTALLDQMYEKNLEYYKQLTMYILAGRQRLSLIHICAGSPANG